MGRAAQADLAACREGDLHLREQHAAALRRVAEQHLPQTQGCGRVPVRLLQWREYVRRTLTAVMCEGAPSMLSCLSYSPSLSFSGPSCQKPVDLSTLFTNAVLLPNFV